MRPPIVLRFRHTFNGEIVETDVIISPRSEWTANPRSRDSSWSVTSVHGELIAACLLTLPVGSSARLLDAYRQFDRECVARGL
jgi:hypothetical protein